MWSRMPQHARRLVQPVALVAAVLLLLAPSAAFATDGVGTMTVAPTYVIDGTSGLYPVFTYTAAGAISGGEISLDVPTGWTAPSSNGFDNSGTQASCGDNPITIVSTRTIDIQNVTLGAGA